MSVILLAATILSSLLVGLGLWRFVDTLNLISPLYEGIGTVLYSSSLYFTQNIELIALALLLSNLRTPSGRGVFLRYHSIVSIILVLVSFAAVTVLGSYGETRNFPIYTLFILSGSNVYYRFDYIVVAIWVAVSLVRAAVYLLLATRMLGELMGYRWGKWMMAVNGILVLLISTVSVRYIKLFQGIYQFLASGIPMYGLLVLLPLLLLFCIGDRTKIRIQNRFQRGKKHEKNKRNIFALLIVLLPLCLTGCMNAAELKERTIIKMVGVDMDGEEYLLTMLQFSPQAQSGEKTSESQSLVIQTKGRSISEAVDQVSHYNGNKVFFGNSSFLVVGEKAAEQGLEGVLNFLILIMR